MRTHLFPVSRHNDHWFMWKHTAQSLNNPPWSNLLISAFRHCEMMIQTIANFATLPHFCDQVAVQCCRQSVNHTTTDQLPHPQGVVIHRTRPDLLGWRVWGHQWLRTRCGEKMMNTCGTCTINSAFNHHVQNQCVQAQTCAPSSFQIPIFSFCQTVNPLCESWKERKWKIWQPWSILELSGGKSGIIVVFKPWTCWDSSTVKAKRHRKKKFWKVERLFCESQSGLTTGFAIVASCLAQADAGLSLLLSFRIMMDQRDNFGWSRWKKWKSWFLGCKCTFFHISNSSIKTSMNFLKKNQ